MLKSGGNAVSRFRLYRHDTGNTEENPGQPAFGSRAGRAASELKWPQHPLLTTTPTRQAARNIPACWNLPRDSSDILLVLAPTKSYVAATTGRPKVERDRRIFTVH
jgi:hypothetical protein